MFIIYLYICQLADHLSHSVSSIGGLIDRVVLLAPFTSMSQVAEHLIGTIPFLSLLLNHNFDNVYHSSHYLSRSSVKPKFFVAHGAQDRIVPIEMGERLSQLIRSLGAQCEFMPIEDADHNDLFAFAQPQMFPFMADRQRAEQHEDESS